MTDKLSLFSFLDNPVVLAILGLALFCYVLLFNLLFTRRNKAWEDRVAIWLKVLPVLLSALPLLGLLGTIAGLLSTFRYMATSGGLNQQMLLSSGIADALITTQLGLVMVIPGLILLTMLRYFHRKLQI